MNPIRPIRRVAGVLAGLAAALLASGAAPAFAMIVPDPHQPYPAPAQVPTQIHTVTRTIVAGGMPGWQIALIVAGAALLTAAVAVLADRARAGRRPAMPTAA